MVPLDRPKPRPLPARWIGRRGPEFGDPGPIDRATLEAVRGVDAAILDRAASRDPAGWFDAAAVVGNRRRRVCGPAATDTMRHAMGPAQGRLLKYFQAVDPGRTRDASCAGLAFDAAHAEGTGTAAETEVRHRV
jgi:MEMO1 family protein